MALEKKGLPMTETMMTPFASVTRQDAEAMSRFPSDGDDDKERRALKAALHVAELRRGFSSVTAVRLHLESLFNVSERQIRRPEKILPYSEIVKLVLKGPISVTNPAHVIEHADVGMLRVAWFSLDVGSCPAQSRCSQNSRRAFSDAHAQE
jgi:hypothetical protein